MGTTSMSADPFRSLWTGHGLAREAPAPEREALLADVEARHPGRDDCRRMVRWDLEEYERPHLPLVVGELGDREAFRSTSEMRLLDMPIREPGGPWVLPEALAPFREVIELAVAYERAINPDFDTGYYAYFTGDQKPVVPGAAQRRVGWHGDAFISPETTRLDAGPVLVDNTYVVSDELPTLFLPGPFSLRGLDASDIRAVLRRFDELAEGREPVRFAPFTLVRMTPFDIHTPDVNDSDRTIHRTFVKIQFSRDRLNMLGNSLNQVEDEAGRPLFSYDAWTWVPRDPGERNNRNSILGWDRPDRERFREVVPAEVDLDGAGAGADWLEDGFFWARKVEGVRAEPAAAGEMLETVGGGGAFRSSFNIAQAGDWKITTSQGDQYFLSDARLRERYEAPDERGECFVQPRGAPSRMALVREPIRYRSPWGAWAFAPAGSVVTRLGPDDVYAILPENFAASYVRCDEGGQVLVAGGSTLRRAREERPGALLRVCDEEVGLGPPVVVVFDLHGTLTVPNWKAALAGVHRRLVADSTDALATAWVEETVHGASDAEVLLALGRAAGGRPLEEIERCFQEERRRVGRTEPLRGMPGVDAFLRVLSEHAVPRYVLTFAHTTRERTLGQLREAGLEPFFEEEHVLTSHHFPDVDERGAFREAGLAHLLGAHPGATPWFFNDTADGIAWTRGHGGVAFGVPQGEGIDWDRRATPLVAAGAHLLVQDWERAAREVAEGLGGGA